MADDDVLGKADALLRRHSVARPAGGADTGGIPVLTDIVGGAMPDGELAQEVFRRVMDQVEGRLAADLENRLSLQLVPQIHAAVAAALADLRQELANAIGDAVTEALSKRR